MNNGNRIAGVLSPVCTPFRKDLSPDHERFVRHCRWLISQNVGLAVFGTTSEGNSLSLDERIELLDLLVQEGIDPGRMMPGVGCCAITETARLTAHAVKLGCAGVLMLPPFYYKDLSDDGLYASFAEVIDRVGDPRLKVYLYHIPPIAHVPLTTGVTERLLKAYPHQIAGMKDSSGDWNNTKIFLDAFAKTGFDIFVGSEAFLLRNMNSGGVGCISATANVNPGPIARLCEGWQSGDADAQQTRLNEVRDAFKKVPMIPAVKAAIAHYSDDSTWRAVRPPLVPLNPHLENALISELDARGFSIPGLTN